jgi:hypothetical protein
MVKNIKLAFKPEIEFRLIGISSHENDYHLSWAINQKFRVNLTRRENLIIFHKKQKEKQEFSLYTFDDEDNLYLYNLISNTSENGFLFPEMRNIDFFLQVYGNPSDDFLHSLISRLNQIDIISTSFLIDPKNLKNPQRLIFN